MVVKDRRGAELLSTARGGAVSSRVPRGDFCHMCKRRKGMCRCDLDSARVVIEDLWLRVVWAVMSRARRYR